MCGAVQGADGSHGRLTRPFVCGKCRRGTPTCSRDCATMAARRHGWSSAGASRIPRSCSRSGRRFDSLLSATSRGRGHIPGRPLSQRVPRATQVQHEPSFSSDDSGRVCTMDGRLWIITVLVPDIRKDTCRLHSLSKRNLLSGIASRRLDPRPSTLSLRARLAANQIVHFPA